MTDKKIKNSNARKSQLKKSDHKKKSNGKKPSKRGSGFQTVLNNLDNTLQHLDNAGQLMDRIKYIKNQKNKFESLKARTKSELSYWQKKAQDQGNKLNDEDMKKFVYVFLSDLENEKQLYKIILDFDALQKQLQQAQQAQKTQNTQLTPSRSGNSIYNAQKLPGIPNSASTKTSTILGQDSYRTSSRPGRIPSRYRTPPPEKNFNKQ